MPNWKKVIVSGSDAVLNKATLSDNLLVTPTTQSAAHSGLLLGFSKYSANFEAGLFAAPDGRIGGSNGNLYIAPRNINDGNGSYLQLGQRDSSTASDKGTVILQAGRSGSNSQVGDMFFGYGDQKIMKLHGATGNVGIGNLLPTEKLQVEGNISASGTGSFTNINMRGDIIPLTDATHNLGDTASRDWNTLFVRTIDIHNQRVNISAAGTTAIFSDHSSVGDGFQFYHLGTEILRLGNDGDYTANFSANITASGNISSSGAITANGFNTIGNISFTGTTNNEINSIVNLTLNADSDSNSGDAYRNIIFENRGTETARINKDGHLGIGNSNPTAAKLVIREDSSYGLRLEDATGHYFRVNTGGDTEIRGDVTVGGILTAQEFHTEFVSASIMFSSGSTKFGDTNDDTHQFTGSIIISSSGTIGPNSAAGIEFGDGTHGNEPTDITIFTANGGEIHLKRNGNLKLSVQDNGIDIDEEVHVRDSGFNNAIVLSQEGHITASGNISASGDITADKCIC